MRPAYYNEIDPYAAQWLRNLIAAGHIAAGDVDERSIVDVRAADLVGYGQCHFFAGIGVWSLALRRAGWPDDRDIWTGSCPCQPFSAAGRGAGFADERHLWPVFASLIRERRPPVVAGEQVASKDADPWIDLVCADLEAVGYAVGAVPFPSAGIGAPHIRDRLYWVADAGCAGQLPGPQRGIHRGEEGSGSRDGEPERPGAAGGLAHHHHQGLEGLGQGSPAACGRLAAVRPAAEGGEPCGLAHADGGHAGAERQQRSGEQRQQPQDGGSVPPGSGDAGGQGTAAAARSRVGAGHPADHGPGPVNGLWAAADWLLCRDGKWRPVEPSTFPLAHGATSRVGRLRAYGNAINAEAATEFIRAWPFLESMTEAA